MMIRGDHLSTVLNGVRRNARAVAVALCLTIPLTVPLAAHAANPEQTAAISPVHAGAGTGTGIDAAQPIPKVLSDADATRYRKIFALQDAGKMKAADKEIKALTDRALMGHVLAQRYLHPRAYVSKYKELKRWMANYADHPQAKRIYKLAKRKGGSKAYVPLPKKVKFTQGSSKNIGVRWEYSTWKAYGKSARALRARFNNAIRRGHTLVAKRILKSAEAKRWFHPVDYDRLAGVMGFKYFLDKRDDWTMLWAGKAADRSGGKAPMAVWGAGLASWRMGDYKKAAGYFEALANSQYASPWMTTAGAYWAARSHLKARQPERVNPLLEQAAAHPRTFYGLLAHQALGTEPAFNWQDDGAGQGSFAPLMADPQGHRGLALIQIGMTSEAEQELRAVYARSDAEVADAVLAVSEAAHLPSLSLRLSYYEGEDDPWPRDAASYPMPNWTPENGWRLDKALVFAFVRQESAFNPQAKSYRGARGLMQLMPATASFIAQDRGYRRSKRNELFDPALNLRLGQSYLEHLLHNDQVNGNLFLLTAAYNGGPGNLNRWLRTMDYQQDPLLFIESLPSRETRIFIERVLSNLWIYRKRFDQPTPSLALLVSGHWPLYTHLDDHSTQQVANSNVFSNR